MQQTWIRGGWKPRHRQSEMAAIQSKDSQRPCLSAVNKRITCVERQYRVHVGTDFPQSQSAIESYDCDLEVRTENIYLERWLLSCASAPNSRIHSFSSSARLHAPRRGTDTSEAIEQLGLNSHPGVVSFPHVCPPPTIHMALPTGHYTDNALPLMDEELFVCVDLAAAHQAEQ